MAGRPTLPWPLCSHLRLRFQLPVFDVSTAAFCLLFWRAGQCLLVQLLLLLFVAGAVAVAVGGEILPHPIYTNSRLTAPVSVMLLYQTDANDQHFLQL